MIKYLFLIVIISGCGAVIEHKRYMTPPTYNNGQFCIEQCERVKNQCEFKQNFDYSSCQKYLPKK